MNKKLAIQVWIVAVVAILVAVNVHSRTYPHIVDNRVYPPVYVPTKREVVQPEPYQWLTKIDTEQGISYQYPNRLDAQFTSFNGPIKVKVSSEAFSCVKHTLSEGGNYRTILETINGRQYCVSGEADASMGSSYSSRDYMTAIGDKLVTISFQTHSANGCSESFGMTTEEIIDCKKEKDSGVVWSQLDPMVDRIVQSIAFGDEVKWWTQTDEKQGVTFQFPNQLGLPYYSVMNDRRTGGVAYTLRTNDAGVEEKNEYYKAWPPRVTIADGSFNCVTTNEGAIGPNTEQLAISDRNYCLTVMRDDAMGNYHVRMYKYVTALSEKLITVEFTINVGTVSCRNGEPYDRTPEQVADCERAREKFPSALNQIVEKIVKSIKFN